MNRCLNKQGSVIGNGNFQGGRQLVFQLRQDLAHFLDHVQRIGTGRAADSDIDRRRTIERTDRVVVLRPHFHAGDIAEQHTAVARDFQRDGGKGFGRLQFGGRIDAGDHVFALYFARCGKVVVAAYGSADITGGQAVTGEAHRVEPQAHGKDLIADNLCFGHARQGRKLGLNHP